MEHFPFSVYLRKVFCKTVPVKKNTTCVILYQMPVLNRQICTILEPRYQSAKKTPKYLNVSTKDPL